MGLGTNSSRRSFKADYIFSLIRDKIVSFIKMEMHLLGTTFGHENRNVYRLELLLCFGSF